LDEVDLFYDTRIERNHPSSLFVEVLSARACFLRSRSTR
jgi:hypothetical protein